MENISWIQKIGYEEVFKRKRNWLGIVYAEIAYTAIESMLEGGAKRKRKKTKAIP